jgi:IclR family KDG regulon transcriptional repressor
MKVQSLDRAFDILELLSREQHGLNLTEIGNRLDLHKSTVYRLLQALKQRGYIEKPFMEVTAWGWSSSS